MSEDFHWLTTPAARPRANPVSLLLAHGAGGAMDSPFMEDMATRIAAENITVARFEFPYMQKRREDGRRRPPDKQPILLAYYEQAVADWRRRHAEHSGLLVIGGKSMGGRMATLIADQVQADAAVILGFPFHPPGRPEKAADRIAHLATLRTPTLIIQGERDPFGRKDEVSAYALSPAITLHWCQDGDHDLKPRRASGIRWADNLGTATAEIAAFA